MNTELEQEVVGFISALSSCCKGCPRRGSTCTMCPSSTASNLMSRIVPEKLAASPLKIKAAAVAATKALILAKIRKCGGEPCYAGDIRIPGVSSARRSQQLAEMVRDGVLVRVHTARSRQLHYYTAAKGNHEKS